MAMRVAEIVTVSIVWEKTTYRRFNLEGNNKLTDSKE